MDAPSPVVEPPVRPQRHAADGPSPPEILACVERVLASRCFSGAPGQRHFLRFVVDETLAGRGHDLKEYVVAVQVLGRPDTFDPRTDSSVRVAARRLRQKLDEYYAGEGRDDEVGIALERGGYRPDFHRREPEQQVVAAPPPANGSARRAGRTLVLALGIGALAVTAAATAWFLQGSSGMAAPGNTIAVLPFANASADPDTDYVCFGVVEDLTTALTRVAGFRVIARASSSRFAEQGLDLVGVGKQLGADLLVEGSVRRDRGRLLVSAQLVETRKGIHVWAQTYEREAAGGVAAQQQVASAIAEAVSQHLGRRPAQAAFGQRPVSPEGLDLYWKGRFVRSRRAPDSLQQAIGFFEKAVDRDPAFAEAHAALGDALTSDAFRQTAPPANTVQRARRELRQALALDPDSEVGRCTLAWLQFFYDHDWPAARTGFTRALEINPSSAAAHNLLALALAAHGRPDEAVAHSTEALRLDPVRYAASNDNGAVLWCAGRYDEAVAASQRALDADPKYMVARVLRGIAHIGRRDYLRARADLEAALGSLGPVSLIVGRLGQAYALSGNDAGARTIAAEMEQLFPKGEVASVHMAFVYAALGNRVRAMECLERAEARHEADVNFIAVDPTFDGMRHDPRFESLLQRLGSTTIEVSRRQESESATISEMAFSTSSRARLTEHDLGRFPGESLFDRVGRAVCRAGCLPRKELFEAWEVARRVRRVFRGGRIVDLCGGHGLLGQVMLLLDNSSPEALVVDTALPLSAAKVHEKLVGPWPRIRGRVTFIEGPLEAVALLPSDIVVSSHACGSLTDLVLERAAAVRARVAVLPCCHDKVLRHSGYEPPAGSVDPAVLEGWIDRALAIDILRGLRLERHGYRIRTQRIPGAITPKNRLLLGEPVDPSYLPVL